MKAEINRIKWKSRRGMRELDLLFENFFKFHADKISESELQTLRELLVYDCLLYTSEAVSWARRCV